jgi:hypothetical protein
MKFLNKGGDIFYMSDQNQKKPVVAAVTGAIIGAGIVAAGVAALKDKKNREKVKKVLTSVKDNAKGILENIKKETLDKKEDIKNKPREELKKVKVVTNSTK